MAYISRVANPKNFGATGQGTVDDWAAIVKAYNWLPASGGILEFTGGNANRYLCALQAGQNPSQVVRSNITIACDPDVYILSQGAARGVNGYSDALFRSIAGARNITLLGGNYKCATGFDGGVFFAFKNVEVLRASGLNMWDTHQSCRLQISHSTDIMVEDYFVGYQDSLTGNYGFEDGIRFESGTKRFALVNFEINSGDDAIALNNEPAANSNTTTGADILDGEICNGSVTTKAGHVVRLYHEGTMLNGKIGGIGISNVSGIPVNLNDGLSIANYAASAGCTIDGVSVDGVDIDAAGVTLSGILVYFASNVSIDSSKIANPGKEGIKADQSSIVNISKTKIVGGAGAFSQILLSNGSKHSVSDSTCTNSGAAGISLSSVGDSNVHDNVISGSAGIGIALAGATTHNDVHHNRIPTSTGAAINEDGGGTTLNNINNNDVTGATAPTRTNTGGANSVWKDNPGYNPIAATPASITVGASPFGYTSGVSDEYVIITGGTVSLVQVNGTTISTNTTTSVLLAPHQIVTVTYSVLPTMQTIKF